MNYSWQVKVYLFENEDFIYQFTRFVLSLTGAYWTMLELIKIQLLMYFFTLGTIWKCDVTLSASCFLKVY